MFVNNTFIFSMARVVDNTDPYSSLYFEVDEGEVDEHGDVVGVPGFIWSQNKSNINIAAHEFSFYYARRIFDDDKIYYDEPDKRHSIGEDRRWTVGRALKQPNRILLVCDTEIEPSGVIRIYSARELNKGEALYKRFENYEKEQIAMSFKRSTSRMVYLKK